MCHLLKFFIEILEPRKAKPLPTTWSGQHLHVEIWLPLDTSMNMFKMHLKLQMSTVKFYLLLTRFSFPSVSASPQMTTWSFQLLKTEKCCYCLFPAFSHNPRLNLSVVLLAQLQNLSRISPLLTTFATVTLGQATLISHDWRHSPLKNLHAFCPQHRRQSELSRSRSLFTSLLYSESPTGFPLSSDVHIRF